MLQKLEYQNKGRGGNVIYTDDQSTISLSFEFGAGDCVAIIFTPTAAGWERDTGRPLADREGILNFIARQAVNDQASGGTYQLTDGFIEIFKS